MRFGRTLLILLTLAQFLPGMSAQAATFELRPKSVISLDVRPMIQVGGQSGTLAPRRLDLDPSDGGVLEFEVAWPVGERSRLRLFALPTGSAEPDVHPVRLEAELVLEDRTRVVARRELSLTEGRTGLFELFRRGAESLSLAISAEATVIHELARPSLGLPVGLRVEVEYMGPHGAVPLETNHLSTFLGEPVTYAFDRGADDSRQSMHLTLEPVSRSADLLEIRIEFSGSLPGEQRLLLSRRETLFTTRQTTSSLLVTHGEPATGYRFRITPDF